MLSTQMAMNKNSHSIRYEVKTKPRQKCMQIIIEIKVNRIQCVDTVQNFPNIKA